MLDRLIRLANIFDRQGRYEQADELTDFVRIAQMDALEKERHKAIERKLGDVGDVITDIPQGDIYDDKPTKRIKDEGYRQPLRPGQEEIMTPVEKTFEPAPGREKKVQVPTLDLDSAEKRDKARIFYTEALKMGDENANSVLQQLDIMDDKEGKRGVQDSFRFYGEQGINAPYTNSLFDRSTKGGGKHLITPWFISEEQSHKFATETRDLLLWALGDKNNRARVLLHYFGADPKKLTVNTLNDLTFDLVLEQMVKPGMGMLAALRAAKAEDEGKDPNTRQLYPENQYRAFHTSWIKQLDPRTKQHEKIKFDLIRYVDDLVMKNLKNFSEYGIGMPEAVDMALSSTITEGMNGKGGLKTYNYTDSADAKIFPLNSKPGQKNENAYPTFSQIGRGVVPELVGQLLKRPGRQDMTGQLGKPYADVDIDNIMSKITNPQINASTESLIRIADSLDSQGKYAAADFITRVMTRVAQIESTEDVADILGSGEEASEDTEPFKANTRPGLENIITRHPEHGGPTIDFIDNADQILDFLGDDPELVDRIKDIIYTQGRGRKEPGEAIFGPNTIRVPQNKSKFDIDISRQLVSTPEQLIENEANYWEHHARIINDKYQRAREKSQYWGKNSHNIDRDFMHVDALRKELHKDQGRIQKLRALVREMQGKEPSKPPTMLENPYRAWDTESLAFFDPRGEGHDSDIQRRLLDIQENRIKNDFGSTMGMPGGLEEGEEKSLALPRTLLEGYDLPKEEKQTDEERDFARLLGENPRIKLPGALKTMYPGQTFGAEVYKRPKNEHGEPIRNRYPTYRDDNLKFFNS